MVTHQEIERQLKAIGAKFTWWGKAEARELEHIIEPGETIMYCLNGRYDGGFAMLCITDGRVILIDKKPLYLTLEDVRYGMISEVDFDGRLVDSTVTICALSKNLRFTSFKGPLLRQATAYIQRRVMEARNHLLDQSEPARGFIETPIQQALVHSFEHRVINPYTRVPFMMRRRLSRFHG